MKEYKIHIDGGFDFVIVSPRMIGSLISEIRDCGERELRVGIGDIMPKEMETYLLNVMNANRFTSRQFRFRQILEDPITKAGLYQVIEEQLRLMDVDDAACFDKVELFELHAGDLGLALVCTIPFLWACKDTFAVFLCTFADGYKEKSRLNIERG